ncbi:MAG TPA: MarR family transcriptional regulator [Spirillospora sp.]|nr:MarR family transcriptional regulator [Spirillospora sp.]
MANTDVTATADTVTAAPADSTADGRPAGAAGAVWDALNAAPGGATVSALAEASGTSRATVTKVLTALEEAGHAVLAPGEGTGRGRTPDVWAPVAPTAPTADTGTSDAAPAATADDAATGTATTPDASTGPGTGTDAATAPGVISPDMLATVMQVLAEEADRRAAAAEALRKAQEEEAERRARVDAELRKAEQRETARMILTDLLSTVTTTLAAISADDDEQITRGMEDIVRCAGSVRRTTRTTIGRTGSGTGAPRPSSDRSAPSPLRPLVANHLNAYPDREFTPGEIAKVLDRSSGAVVNALDTLVARGEAVLTCERPRRFQTATPDTSDNTGTGHTGTDTTGGNTGHTERADA